LKMKAYDLAKEVLFCLADEAGVSGYEHGLQPLLKNIFAPLATDLEQDFFGNFYARKRGLIGKHAVMLAAHGDEIGLILSHIDDRGFLHFTTVGGIDERTLLQQEVTVHGREKVPGIISAVPLKAAAAADQKAIGISQLVIDIGYGPETALRLVKPGDVVSLVRSPLTLLNDKVAGKALDDRAGISVMAVCLHELAQLKHGPDVIAVTTVQEEIGLRGASTSSERLQPELAVAIDVTHGQTPDSKNQVAIQLGKGPVITVGPNIHPQVQAGLTSAAQEARIPYQIQPVAGATGTDARVIQLTGRGIPTGLVSVPLRYMHTAVETASLTDIVDSGKLLARFIAGLPGELEESLCY
jgi:putative aminopeptidase FrvX